MRKQFKKKKTCCALCNPHKRGWENRWRAKDRAKMAAAEKDMRHYR